MKSDIALMFENVASSSPEGSGKAAKNKRSKNSPKKPKKPCKTRLFGIGCILTYEDG